MKCIHSERGKCMPSIRVSTSFLDTYKSWTNCNGTEDEMNRCPEWNKNKKN